MNDFSFCVGKHFSWTTAISRSLYSLGAFVDYDGPHLTINGIDYRVSVWFYYDANGRPGWSQSYAGGPALGRPARYGIDGEPTEGARKVWREKIAPAIIAALTGPDGLQAIATARAAAADRFRDSLAERVSALRAEADRLEAIR